MPASRVAVSNAATSVLAAASGTSEGPVEVILVNRGPDSVFIIDSTPVDPAASSFEVASGEGFQKKLGRKEVLYGICAATKTATVHVFRDDID